MSRKRRGKVHIGTSGWHYKHWKGAFYPDDVSSGDYLEYYRRHFRTAEINNSFYQIPEKKTLWQWRSKGLDIFVYFDNDQNGYAPRNALRLTEMMGED